MTSPTSPTAPRPPSRSRTSSITESILNARPPPGVLADIGGAIGRGPSFSELRRDSSASNGYRRNSAAGLGASLSPAPIAERRSEDLRRISRTKDSEAALNDESSLSLDEEEGDKKGGWWKATQNGAKAFWGYFTTPLGFFVTIYMLNVVAWGGMLFLLLCGAAPAMCHPTCNDDYSARNVWIEIDSQILNALFCVTGFGLVPWRFRDLYYLLQWRMRHKPNAYLKLQEIHSSWFRPPPPATSEEAVNTDLPEPVTGERAPPTKRWKLDYVIWLYVWNTFFQCFLSGFMWGMSRFERPPWTTGMFVGLACLVAGLAGGMFWWEGRKVKKVEGKRKKEERASEDVEVVVNKEELERGRTP